MVVDTKRCIGCFACTVACKSKNNLPNDMLWNRVETVGGDFMDTPSGTFATGLSLSYLPVACQHCDNPFCVEVCPTGASYKDEQTGRVLIDHEVCIGCKTCMVACPYEVRQYNENEPEYYLDFPLGDFDAPAHVANTVEKCTFCANRVDRGEKPSCMMLCPARARFWGDLDDPASDVSRLIEGKETYRLLEEKGSEPNCYYI
ncbi:MAG: 4Fe-4S dicluster domain-containing protein [Coriobacteriaceae bacterium]|nr:4Fe-4S dicluster domain-containing protein [Coriobacteriaceae bacterium]